MSLYDKIFPPKKMVLANGEIILEKRTRAPFIILLLLVAGAISVEITGFDLETLFDRWSQFFVIIDETIPPNWDYLSNIWKPLIDTIKMSLLGSILGAVVAVPVAILSSSNMMKSKIVTVSFKFILSILRTLPTLVSALIATYIFGLGTLAGTVAIFLFTLSYVGKLLYEQIENVDMSAFEAMESMGLAKFQAFRYAILPQILPYYLSTSLFCFEGNVRYASILGYVGAGGIGLLLNESIGWRMYANVGTILLLLVITVFIIENVSQILRSKLN